MRIKSYFANAVEDAMAQARQEMGDDAMLVKTRRTMPEASHLGSYEVVFAVDIPGESDGDEPASLVHTAGGGPSPDRLLFEVSELKRELEGMRRALARSVFAPGQRFGNSSDAAGAYATLTAADVNPEVARELVEAAEGRATGVQDAGGRTSARMSPAAFGTALTEEIESRIKVRSELGCGGDGPRIVALAGPPGAGKTTTLIKLAIVYGLASRRPALLLSTDTYRVAAADQLRAYATILGIGCQVLETANALAQAIEENRGKEFLFIDTPGLGGADMDAGAGLARLLAARSDIDTHLVLPASMKPADLARAVDAYQVVAPQKLLFTKLDETNSFGPILNEAMRTGKPLSFFTSGQRIPEDLETVTIRRMVELVLSGGKPQSSPRSRTAA